MLLYLYTVRYVVLQVHNYNYKLILKFIGYVLLFTVKHIQEICVQKNVLILFLNLKAI